MYLFEKLKNKTEKVLKIEYFNNHNHRKLKREGNGMYKNAHFKSLNLVKITIEKE